MSWEMLSTGNPPAIRVDEVFIKHEQLSWRLFFERDDKEILYDFGGSAQPSAIDHLISKWFWIWVGIFGLLGWTVPNTTSADPPVIHDTYGCDGNHACLWRMFISIILTAGFHSYARFPGDTGEHQPCNKGAFLAVRWNKCGNLANHHGNFKI